MENNQQYSTTFICILVIITIIGFAIIGFTSVSANKTYSVPNNIKIDSVKINNYQEKVYTTKGKHFGAYSKECMIKTIEIYSNKNFKVLKVLIEDLELVFKISPNIKVIIINQTKNNLIKLQLVNNKKLEFWTVLDEIK